MIPRLIDMMKSLKVNQLTIPSPCNANYSSMQEVAEGKHCTICSQSVTDFTGWSKEEIVVYLRARSNEKVCGRFGNRQLANRKFGYRLRFAVITAVSLLLFKSESKAQQKPEVRMPDSLDVLGDSVVLVIRGELTDGNRKIRNGKVAALNANGDTISVAIAKSGRFELRVPVAHPKEPITIVASSPGFRRFKMHDYISTGRNVLKIDLEPRKIFGKKKRLYMFVTMGCPSF